MENLNVVGERIFSFEEIQECWQIAYQAGILKGQGIEEEKWQTFESFIGYTENICTIPKK